MRRLLASLMPILVAACAADIIAVRGDPLRDISTTLDVRFVMKNGDVYKKDSHG